MNDSLNWESKFINALFNLSVNGQGKRRNKDGTPVVLSYEKPFDECINRLEKWGWVGRLVKPLRKGQSYDDSREYYRAVCLTEKGLEEISELRGMRS